ARGRLPASDAGCLQGLSRAAVRVLHARDDHERHRPHHPPSACDSRRGPRRARRQPVPLHRLPQHHLRRHESRGGDAVGGRQAMTPYVGRSVERKEDYRFVTGVGTYTDDIVLPRQAYGYFLRSPHAHARIRGIDSSAATAAPGVLGVYTARDLTGIGGLPCGWLIHSIDGTPMKEPKHPVLAEGKVRHVGDPLALVVAESAPEAKAAAALIEVDYEALPAVVETGNAASSGIAVHDEAPDNVCFTWAIGDQTAVDAAFARAAHVTRFSFANNR